MTVRIFNCAAAIAVAMLLTSTASANLLGNPGFEDNSAPPQGHAAPSWPTFTFTSSSVVDSSGTNQNSGTNAIAEINGGASSGSTGVFQQINGVIPGETYTLSVWAKAGSVPFSSDDTYGGAVARIQFELDGGADLTKSELALGPIGSFPGVSTGPGLLSDVYQQFTISGVAPPTATQLKVQLYSRHASTTIYFDDADLQGIVTPEPTSIGLALLGSVGFLGLRRRARR